MPKDVRLCKFVCLSKHNMVEAQVSNAHLRVKYQKEKFLENPLKQNTWSVIFSTLGGWLSR